MKFSIVTPSYNYGSYIETAIESVLAQASDGIEIEHIVVDAGSTDSTVEVLERYPHLIWTSEPDKGMSDGINKGFRRATGDWMMWLNADDGLRPGALASVVAHIARHPKADVVYGDCVFVDSKFKEIRRQYQHGFDHFVLLYGGCYIPSTSCFFQRAIIDEGHLLDIEFRVCMDFEYFVRLDHLGYRFSYMPKSLANFRWHEDNTSHVLSERRFEERQIVKRKYLKLKGQGFLCSDLSLALLLWTALAKRKMNKWTRTLFRRYQ